MSLTWWNCERGVVSGRMPRGHDTTSGVRVPPKCAAISLVLWNGVEPAQAQPAWYMLSVLRPPSASRPPKPSSSSRCCEIFVEMRFCASSSTTSTLAKSLLP
ncbi:hypothetical protein D3C72_2133250 [compost metagenome]